MSDTPEGSKRLGIRELLARIARLPREEQTRAKRALLLKYKPAAIVNRTREAEELETLGWEAWLSELAPHVFRGTHADFHRKFWDWYWPLLIAKRNGERIVNLEIPLAYLLTLHRGGGKSTTVEWATIAMGALLGQTLALYVSSTAKLASNHLTSIREEIEGSAISKYYPALSDPRTGKFDNRYGWNKELLATTSGLIIFALGLEEEVRGVKVQSIRPALIVLDEFDSKTDSPDVVLKKESIIGGSLFGTQVEDTLILMAQNLIHRHSVATRTVKRRNQLLTDRVESGLVPAFTSDLDIKMVGTKWKVIKGKPLWDYFDRAAFEKFLNSSGPIEVFAEYQHQFDQDREGKVFKQYNDLISVITEEDFNRVYGTPQTPIFKPPASWNKYLFNDTARTKTEWHANVAGTLSMSSENTPLPGITFLYDCLSFEEETPAEDCAVAILKQISPLVQHQGTNYQWEELLRTIIAREGIGRFVGSMAEQTKAQRAGLARIIPKFVTPLLARLRYLQFRVSHEAEELRRVYKDVFGMNAEAAQPGDGAGVGLINLAMKVDPDVPDPFGRMVFEPSTGMYRPLMGMSRFYIIVKKEKLPYPEQSNPALLHGSDLARFQLTEHRWLPLKVTASGEEERGQEKRNDDFPNGLQFFYMDHSIRARELTPEEQAELLLDPSIQQATIDAETDPEKKQQAYYKREIALQREYSARITAKLQQSSGGSKLASYKKLRLRGR